MQNQAHSGTLRAMPEHAPEKEPKTKPIPAADKAGHQPDPQVVESDLQPETDGPAGPEPTRFGDWERNGRCIDF
ncbi:MAG: DUF1674 domain-containing protein [Gammaproteobacteria bacterium]|jgi:hypothetical protein|nr:DUF1674 domain-containing protein [Gammaproteobacteria bacterium]MDP7270666.1 DUF1674 domain-containing protein [Gammaproteobacteria bacterium]HJP03690.1 DUF1674 domain-containing protein [Gammaproteobacteria bacterium]